MAWWVSTPTLLAGADHRPNIHDHDLDDDDDVFPAETFILMRKKMVRRGIMMMRMKATNAAAFFFRQHIFACSHFLLPPATFLQDFPSQRQEVAALATFFPWARTRCNLPGARTCYAGKQEEIRLRTCQTLFANLCILHGHQNFQLNHAAFLPSGRNIDIDGDTNTIQIAMQMQISTNASNSSKSNSYFTG